MNICGFMRKAELKYNEAMDEMWKVPLELQRLLFHPYYRMYFLLLGVKWPKKMQLFGKPIIQKYKGSTISIGSGVQLNSSPGSNPLSPNHPVFLSTRAKSARLSIGEKCGITGGTICAMVRVSLGSRVSIGANTVIADTDFHPLNYLDRNINPKNGEACPIVIEDDVFIGMNVIILKGVTIGRGSVVGAGSVVTRDVPPLSKVAGNPARIVGTL